ncbi:MAG: hypothetical protein F6K50_05675 [Moorea sp. SIO3I7]|nr:hypothetical protein [Moorena sp. SIO3I7]
MVQFLALLLARLLFKPQGHHLRYLGGEDEASVNVVAVCRRCHEEKCHTPENWNQGDFDDIWSASQVESFEDRIRLGLTFLTKESDR